MIMLLPAGLIVAAAAFRGITGFGFALIAVLVLSLFMSPLTAVPLVIACDLVITGLILLERKAAAIDWPIARLVLGFAIIGAIAGAFAAGFIPDQLAQILIAVVVLLAALIAMIKHPPAILASRSIGVFASVLLGFLLSAFGVGGPVIVAWLLAIRLDAARFRGTLAVIFGLVDLMTLGSRFALGIVPAEVGPLLLIYVPLTLIGYAAGLFIVRRMTAETWRRFSAAGLVFIALAGGAQTVFVLAVPYFGAKAPPILMETN